MVTRKIYNGLVDHSTKATKSNVETTARISFLLVTDFLDIALEKIPFFGYSDTTREMGTIIPRFTWTGSGCRFRIFGYNQQQIGR